MVEIIKLNNGYESIGGIINCGLINGISYIVNDDWIYRYKTLKFKRKGFLKLFSRYKKVTGKIKSYLIKDNVVIKLKDGALYMNNYTYNKIKIACDKANK